MSVSMYQNSVPVMQRLMKNLIGVLEKAEAHAAAKKIDAEVLPNCRLTADMFPLKLSATEPGGRTIMSAPTPRDRFAISCSVPRLNPTRVSTMVTCTPMAKALKRVRIGRCLRFSRTRRLVKSQ